MNTCATCGAVMRSDERQCPTCGTGPSVDELYAPGEALVAENLDEPAPTAPMREGYGVKLELEAVLTKAFNWWTGSLGQLVVTQLLVMALMIPVVAGTLWAMFADSPGLEAFSTTLIVGVIALVLVAVPAGFASMAAAVLVIRDRASGIEPGLSGLAALRLSVRFLGRLLLGYLLLVLVFGLTLFPCGVLFGLKQWWAGGLLVIPSIGFLFYLWIVCTPLLPVIVAEDLGIFAALRRSNELLIGCKWRVLGYNLMSWLVIATMAGALGFVGLIPVLGQILSLAANLLLNPLWYSINFAIYAGLSDRQRASARPL